MRLSIINYGTGVNVDIPAYAKREDDALMKSARDIVEAQNMGMGGIIVSEVMHTDLANLNNRIYVQKGLVEAVKTFYQPHYTPFLMHHNSGGGLFSSGDPSLVSVGTSILSKMIRRKVETATGIASGYVKVATFVPETSMIGNQKALDTLQSRQVMTLSIGSRINDEDYKCSICENSLYSDDCEHTVGQTYEKEKCYAMVHNPLFREYSAVYTPADINALVRRMDIMEGEGFVAGEEHIVDKNYGGYLSIYEVAGTVYPSVVAGNVSQEVDNGDSAPHQPTQPEERNNMADKNKDPKTSTPDTQGVPQDTPPEKVPEEIAELIEGYKRVIAGYKKRIESLQDLVDVLAKALKNEIEEEDLPDSDEPNDDPNADPPDEGAQGDGGAGDSPNGTPVTPDEGTGDKDKVVDPPAGGDTREGNGADEANTQGGEDSSSDEPAPKDTPDETIPGEEGVPSYREILERKRSLNTLGRIGRKDGRVEGSLPFKFKI
jgi:hypothetical protein